MTSKYYVVLSTTANEEQAADIARHLLGSHLAACVQIIKNIRSIYTWENKMCDESECLLIIKTSAGQLAALQQEIKRCHTYQVPEIIALPVADGFEPYLEWISQMTSDPGRCQK